MAKRKRGARMSTARARAHNTKGGKGKIAKRARGRHIRHT